MLSYIMSTATTEQTQLPLPPLIPGLPVLGNATALSKDLVAFAVEQYKRVGPIFRVRALNREFVVLAGPEANVFITQEGADKITSRQVWQPYGQEFGVTDYLQDIDGEPHLRLRKLFKKAYSASTLMADIPMLVDIVQKTLDRFQDAHDVSTLYLSRTIVTEQLGRALANYAPGTNLENMITTIRLALNVHVTGQSPAFMLKLPAYRRAKQAFLDMGRAIIAQHQQTTRPQPDLIDDILTASQQEEFKDLLGDESQLLLAALGPFVAGLDTASNECTFMLYCLLQNPAILAQCTLEADTLFASGMPSFKQIQSLHILHNAMMETIRLHSIGPAITRNASQTFEFAGFRVEKGQSLILVTSAAHFLPELFADPYTFDITRYDPPRKEHKQRGAYAPFGLGTHLCLGAGAAEAQIAFVLATLLHLVRLEPTTPLAKLRIRQDPTPTLGNAFRVRITERRHTLPTP
jgi:cytochrome P450